MSPHLTVADLARAARRPLSFNINALVHAERILRAARGSRIRHAHHRIDVIGGRSMHKLGIGICIIALALVASAPSRAVVIGEIDTFQSLTTENWTAGGGPGGATPPFPPAVVPDGGPAGVGDAFLEITAVGGSGPGSRLTAMNPLAQWSGNYL